MYKRKIEKSDECLNCDTSLSGENFCPNCGQLNNQRKPNVFELFFEMLSNLFAFDSKFYRSIGPLLFKPGKLSLAFIAGKRQQYMLPIRMFIVITILFLFVNSIDTRMEYDQPAIEKETVSVTDSSGSDSDLEIAIGIDSWDKIIKLLQKNDTLKIEEGLKQIEVEPTFGNRLFYHQTQKFIHSKQGDVGNYILSKFLIYALLFIPFLAFLLKFFYLNLPKYFYIDHFIFAVHQQTALMTIILLDVIVSLFIDVNGLLFILMSLYVLHLIIALRTFYKEKWWLTIFKFILINIGFFFISVIFVVLAGMVTFLLY